MGSDIAFHPVLPLAACAGKNSLVLFNRENRQLEKDRFAEPVELESASINKLFFSPDAKHLLAKISIAGTT